MAATHQDFDLCLEQQAPNEFVAYTPDGDGGRTAEHAFSLRTGTLKMHEDLERLEAYSLHKELVKDDFHVQFGRGLYRAALGGDVGACFAERLAAARASGAGLRVRLRVDEGAPALMNLPWEFMHDGEDFLVTRWETPISRLPLAVARRDKPPLERTLRMLVVISSPLDLAEQRVLNTEREQEVILAALDRLQRKRLVEIDFCEDAALDTIQDYFSEQEYDVLHFTGHGVFDAERGRGELLLEDERGYKKPLTNEEFAALLRAYPSLRLVVLSACQSARTANNDGYAGLSRRLLKQGVPAVLAMQYSVLDTSAILFADRFHAIAYSDVRGQLGGGGLLLVYVLPLACWLVSLCLALLVFFPRTCASNVSSWRESKAAFDTIVAYKHARLKAAGVFLALGALALVVAMGVYLAG